MVLTALFCGAQFASAANTAYWIAVPGTSANTNWSNNLNWTNVGVGNTTFTNNDVVFGNAGAVGTDNTVNSAVDVSSQANSLTFTNQSSQFQTISIGPNIILTNNNALNVGSATGIDANTTKVNFTGGGTFVQRGNTTVRNNCNTSGSTSLATLDLSGLSYFISGSNATFNVGGTGSETRSAGQLVLAAVSNNITVGTLNFQTTSGNGGNSGGANIRLGAGTNIINAGTLNLVAGKAVSGTINFPGSTGGLRIRGANGNADDTSRATITIMNRNSGGTGTMVGTADFIGHPVDIKAGTITVGTATSNPSSAGQNGTANLRLNMGTVDATSLNIGVNTVANANTVANVEIGTGASLIVSNISLVNLTAGTATGNLFVGGSVTTSGNVGKNSTAGIANVTLTNNTAFIITPGHSLGASGVPLDNLTLNNSTMTLPAPGNASAVVNNLIINGTTDTINVSSCPGLGQFPVLIYSTVVGTPDFVLGTIAPGFQGYISNNVAANSVDIVITNSVIKNDVWRGNVSSNWDTSTVNWFAGNPTNYAQGDSVVFDDTLTANSNVNLTITATPSITSFTNSSTTYSLSGTGKISGATTLIKDGSATVTLTESGGDNFNGGIIVANGTLILDNTNATIGGGLSVASAGTLQIGNNDANGALPSGGVAVDGSLLFKRTADSTVAQPITGAGSLTKVGTAKLTLTAANTYSGATTVTAGTLALSGAGSLSNSTPVNVTNATLDLSAASQPVTLGAVNLTNSTVTLAVSSANAIVLDTTVNMGGAGNTINITTLPAIASYPVTLVLAQSANPVSGFNATLGTLPAATPAYSGSVSTSPDQLSIVLTLSTGPVGLRPSVLWTGADSATNITWSDRLNWQLPGAPTTGDNVVFNNTAAQTASALSTPGGGISSLISGNISNIVDANFSVSTLTFTNLGDTYHNTFINSGLSLTVTNTLTLGTVDTGAAAHGLVTVSGANAALNVSNTGGNLQLWNGSGSSGGSQATLDLSALDTFNASVSRLAIGASVNNAVNRPSGVLYLAKTNTINAAFQTTTIDSGTTTANGGIVVGDCNGNAGTASTLYLGQVNTISADTIGIGRQKATGHLLFNPTFANTAPYPTVTFQGFSSSRVGAFQVANGAGNSGTTTFSADADLSGGIVNAMINSLVIGRASTNGTGANTTTGTMKYDAGTINANTIHVGYQSTANVKSGVGTLVVASNNVIGIPAALTVLGNLNIGDAAGGTGAANTAGTLVVSNGTVHAYAIVPGVGSSSTITVAGGRLITTNAIGSGANPLTTLNLAPFTTDNAVNILSLSIAAGAPGITATTLNLDAQDTTTNIINVESVGAVGPLPAEVPLIQYGTMNFTVGTTFNVGLGTLPTGYVGTLTNDTANSMIAVVLTSALNPQPKILAPSVSGTNLVFSGTNGFANRGYYLLATTNLTFPLASWTRLATNTFDEHGNFSVSTPIVPTIPSRFYSIQVP
jgi:autotransporter-associated beta strand protein